MPKKPLSYLSQTALFQFLPLGHRLFLSSRSKSLRELHRREGGVTHLKADVKQNARRRDGGLVNYSGSVAVDGVEYTFRMDAKTRSTEIRCSLRPEKALVVAKMDVVRDYFQHFLTAHRAPVKNVELVEFYDAFRGFTSSSSSSSSTPKILSLKWSWERAHNRRLPIYHWLPLHDPRSFEDVPDDVAGLFERIEMHNLSPDDWSKLRRAKNVTKHLVVATPPSSGNDVFRGERQISLERIVPWLWLDGMRFELTHYFTCTTAFMTAAEAFLAHNFLVGSQFTAIYSSKPKGREDIIRLCISHWFPNRTVRRWRDKECFVVAVDADASFTAIFRDYFEPEAKHRESYTIIKLPIDVM